MSKVAVIGLGYVGFPLAVQAAEKSHTVVGIDLKQELVDMANSRTSPFTNDTRFAAALARVSDQQFSGSNNFDDLADADVIVICVPTPTDDNIPDLSFVEGAAKEIGKRLRIGQLVILESTVNAGATRDNVLPILEGASGLQVGQHFNLAHCPERIDPGNPDLFVGNLNRVVGGITPTCTIRAAQFYSDIIDAKVTPLGSTEEAEFVKSWENSHRNVMIALANEAAVICDAMDMDINNVLEGLQSKVDQFGLRLAQPGIGPGGHCIPEDIHYVIKKARQNGIDTRFLDSAAELNDKMPRYAVSQLQQLVGSGKDFGNIRVALLGLAYKENIEDARRSPALEVAHLLSRRAGSVIVHDPYVDMDRVRLGGVEKALTLEEALDGADAVFVATAHRDYREQLTPDMLERHNIKWVYDGRNCLKREDFRTSIVAYKGVGRR
jgi:UDP-N-acetyl-D-glucosamine dehydrogenase